MPILPTMRSTFDFCLPIKSDAVADGPDWLHEIKYDGYRLRLERDGDRCLRDWLQSLPINYCAGITISVSEFAG
jgi:hypothetical protein